jgi:putative peptidoglycan lipid II flippase
MTVPPSSEVTATDAAQADAQADTNRRVASATLILAIGNIASRVLGLGREFVLSNLFGAGRAVDAFKVATNIPTSFYDLLIGGHVNGAIIPVLSEIATRDGREALWGLVSILVSMLTAVLAAFVVLVVLFAPQVVQLMGGSGFDAATLELSANLLRMTAPALIFMSLFAVLSGTLYALRSFSLPAFAGAVFNGTIVLVSLALAPPLQLQITLADNGWAQISATRTADGIAVVALGWLAGAVAQLVLQTFGLRDAKLRLRLNWQHPALGTMVKLYAPVMLSLLMDTLIIRPFSYNLASGTGEGSIGYMGWATTLIQFPQGLVATAISIAILPTLARQAVLAKATPSEAKAFKDTLGLGLRLTMVLIVPAAAALMVLARPIVALLFEHGQFTPNDTLITAQVLRLYLFGLPFAALDLLLVYAFYARQDTRTPALIGVVSLAVYMAVALGLVNNTGIQRLMMALGLVNDNGLYSLMLADSLKHITHALIAAYLLRRQLGGFGGQRLLPTIFKTLAAGLGLAVTAWLMVRFLAQYGAQGFAAEAGLLIGAGGVGTLVYLGMAWVLRVDELRWLLQMMRQRLRR